MAMNGGFAVPIPPSLFVLFKEDVVLDDGALISEHLPAAPLVPDARASCARSAVPATEGDDEEGDGAGPESLLFVVKELPELAGSTDEELAAKFSALKEAINTSFCSSTFVFYWVSEIFLSPRKIPL